ARMNALDYVVVTVYLGALLGLGFIWRSQPTESDYFLGGRKLGWAPLSLSVMATQLSAVSFISAPAFVGLREGGGLKWLAYEISVPLSMILVMFVIAPVIHRAGVVSIYEFLERRFGRTTRLLISISFQIVRAVSTGVMVYAMGIILEVALSAPFWASIIGVGVITLVYSVSGGMKAVVYGDAIQMVLITAGLVFLAFCALGEIGGFSAFWREVDPARFQVIDAKAFGLSGDEFGFIPMLFGGFILYASYYGCDQTQAQRIMSARDIGDARRLLFANGVLRFPLVLLYCFTGLFIGVAVMNDPAMLNLIPPDKPDYMMPVYIAEKLPHGIIGLLYVAILAAAMSSLSSAINSLAAVSLEDLSAIGLIRREGRARAVLARWVTVFWGVLILILSAFAGAIAPTVIEAINKVGSAMFGPILAVFLAGILSKRIRPGAVNLGLLAGVALNIYLWRAAPEIFWMWWNVTGFVAAIAVMCAAHLTFGANRAVVSPEDSSSAIRSIMALYGGMLVAFFLVILAVCLWLGAAGGRIAS
ncbi:MAG: sodium/solute symporter, partial [Parvularculaceae bacterium]|nr:sodium/solute symporter [Parvularculaceae bacterium]